MANKTFTPDDVLHISVLAAIPVTAVEQKNLASGFTKTMPVVDHLFSVDVSKVGPTHQVTGLQNVLRKDVVDKSRMFTQKQALANAPKTHNGYIVVPRVNVEVKK